jgi:type IV pilus assembly protein PilQ
MGYYKTTIIFFFWFSFSALAVEPIVKTNDECVNVDFSSIPLSQVVAFYAKASGESFVLDSSVTAVIDLHLNCVKLTAVLDSILFIAQATQQTKNGITYILPKSNLSSVPVSPASDHSSPVLPASDNSPPVSKLSDTIQLVKVFNSLSAEIVPLLTIADLTVKSLDSDNSLYLVGSKDAVQKGLDAIKLLDKPRKQYTIKAKLIATSDTVIKKLGVSLSGAVSSSNSSVSSDFSNGVNAAVAGATGGMSLIYKQAGALLLRAQIDAAITDGDASLVSQPQTIAYDNKESSITQGLRIPYQTQLPQGGYSINFIDAALVLRVTPRRGDAVDKIILDVYFSKNSAGLVTAAGVQIETREIKTTVALRSGETVVLGGIEEASVDSSSSGIPYLRDIPYLGYVFGSEQNGAQNNKILLMITPTLI